MDAAQNLPPHLRGEFGAALEEMQMKDSIGFVLSYVLKHTPIHTQ